VDHWLELQHGAASALLMRLRLSSSAETRRELWPIIRAELLSHERAERQEVYPAFAQDPDLRVMATEHDADANGLEDAIREVDSASADSPQWQPALDRLIALVQEHVNDEEQEYFPIADRVLADRSDALLERFEKAKSEAKKQLTM
jgi:hemerythrin-like domain-containing protein